jgi:hypothetical protein
MGALSMFADVGIDGLRRHFVLTPKPIIRPASCEVQPNDFIPCSLTDRGKLVERAYPSIHLLHVLHVRPFVQMRIIYAGLGMDRRAMMHDFHAISRPSPRRQEERDNVGADETALLKHVDSAIARTALAGLPQPTAVLARSAMLTERNFRPKTVSKSCSVLGLINHRKTAFGAVLSSIATGRHDFKGHLARFVGTDERNTRNTAHQITSTAVKGYTPGSHTVVCDLGADQAQPGNT